MASTDKPRPVPVSERAAKEHLYGCHFDLTPGENPDGCVIDEGNNQNCTLADSYPNKWECPWWRLRSDAGRM